MTGDETDDAGGDFEFHGKQISLVEPADLQELVDALSTQDIIKLAISEGTAVTYSSDLEELLSMQKDYIDSYVSSLPDYDNTYLNKNIRFLLKRHKIRMGDLERVLGISSGYISRTMHKETSKKLSIDVVWKIANVFGVELDRMIDTDFSVHSGNLDLISDFMKTLRERTEGSAIEWENLGGSRTKLSDTAFEFLPISEKEDGSIAFLRKGEKKNRQVFVEGDIFWTADSDDLRMLTIIPYRSGKGNRVHYDFGFYWLDDKKGKPQTEKIFCSEDEKKGLLDLQAKALYECIRVHLEDVPLSAEVKAFMKDYMKKGR